MSRLKNCENFLVLAVFLGITGLISALILAWVSGLTRGPIEAARAQRFNRSLREVMDGVAFDNDPAVCVSTETSPSGWKIEFFGIKNQGRLVAVVARGANPTGYSGPIQGLVSMEPSGKISKVVITEQTETPGLGAEVCTRKFQRTIFNLGEQPKGLAPNVILDQFTGMTVFDKSDWKPGRKGGKVHARTGATATRWKVVQDGGSIIARTGATVTSRAVARLVYEMALTYAENRTEIMSALTREK